MKNSIIIAQQVQSEDHSGAEQARQSLQGGSVGVHVRQISHQSRTRSGQEPQRPRHRPQSARQSETGRPAVHEAQEMKPALFLSSLPLVDTILIIMVASLSIRMKYIWCVFSTTINSFQFDENGRLLKKKFLEKRIEKKKKKEMNNPSVPVLGMFLIHSAGTVTLLSWQRDQVTRPASLGYMRVKSMT